ncbi:hypothetical protein FHW36_10659 [Chitinophaga polysaccharea]|uniref:Uncharacterized protein n=1 Tax=Chitinophaga polysaccharea TaxID=1293035 RepID=A0A561PL55_9BACT|nr:hypothetical protein [Chitinophaga polysaccharea]TWF38836.1 hypothetical protein FHW36_10659 [Chitinophaga polysaccharea]
MARKDKISEMQDRLKGYKAYLVDVDFIAYSVHICVLADSVTECRDKLDAAYPRLRTTIVHQLSEVIV